MNDLISRQAAIDATAYATSRVTISGKRGFKKHKEEFEKACVAIRDKYIEALKALPAVQKERKKGKWEIAYLDHEAMGERPRIFYCSVCNNCVVYPLHFCPNCGADMWGEENG